MIKSKGIISFKGNLSFLFLFLLLNGFAQPSFRFFTTADGMASNQIYNLYRDSKGFLWMGHSLGLTRFDGNRFTDYSTPDQNSLGITNIHEDKNGTLWCHNFGGQIFYIKNNVLKVFEKYNWKTQQSFPSITISGNNELIASHIEGIYVYSIDDGKDTILGREKNLGLFFNYGFASIRGNIYNILESSLFRITRDSLVPIKAQSAPTLKEKKGHLIIGSFKDSIYLLSNDRSEVIVVQVTQNSYRISRSFDAPEGAFIISVPNDDEAWICGKKIAFCINDPSKKIENINVTSLVSDKENNLWISTLQNGIGLWKSLNQNTQDIQTGNNLNEIINTLNLWQNKLVSGSSLGRLGFYDSTGRIIQTINLSDNLSIAALKSSNNNTLLLGTNFLKEFSSAGSTLKTISTNSAIKSICQDSMGNYYVANAYSLDKVLPDGKLFKIRLKRCYSVDYSRSMNTVYTAFIDGVFAYNGKKLFELKPNGKSIYSPSLLVNGEDLFVATISDGIYFGSAQVNS
ncbi:MAG: hypothetical protein MUE99_07710 [Chitinophagaceae bacterium]|nr:hypothetical protein [Chitinophagaceae bacterium]